MRPVVRETWFKFSEPFEGRVPWMYQDVKGLVTIGVGNLIDPVSLALDLPFIGPDGELVSRADIDESWLKVKHHPSLARLGHRAAAIVSGLRLTKEAIDSLVLRKLDEMDRHLLKRFPAFDSWPACAQCAVLSMSWAMGPAFRYPKLEGALLADDWGMAANECWISEQGNPGVHPRNVANRFMFLNAGTCHPDELVWDRRVDSEPDTLPDVPRIALNAIMDVAEWSVEQRKKDL